MLNRIIPFVKSLVNPQYLQAVIIFVTASFLTALLVSYNADDPSFNTVTFLNSRNNLGITGSYVSDLLWQYMGSTNFLLIFILFNWSFIILKFSEVKFFKLRMIAATIGLLVCNITVGSISHSTSGVLWPAANKYIANLPGYILAPILLLSALLQISLVLFSLGYPFRVYFTLISYIKSFIITFKKNYINTNLLGNRQASHAGNNLRSPLGTPLTFSRVAIDVPTGGQTKGFSYNSSVTHLAPEEVIADSLSQSLKNKPLAEIKSVDLQNNNSSIELKVNTISFSKKPLVNNMLNNDFQLPSLDLLSPGSNQNVKLDTQEELLEKAEGLIKALNDFGVKGKIIDINQGPVVTLYEFEPAAGTKSSRVIGLADDIARTLCAVSARISVVPGRNVLGIELPNKYRQFFRLRELFETQAYNDTSLQLPIVLGKDLAGKPYVADLAKMPHLLVAGTTGSGKSVAINAMIVSLLYRHTPKECKFIMIDPKMLELSVYDNIPHLLSPVVTEPGKAVVALKWAVKEMENRYRLMSNLGVRNIQGYNTRITQAVVKNEELKRTVQTGFDSDTGRPIYESIPISMEKLPYIVVIVDEMADLMLVAGKDIESSIQRLAQMARAAGIHLIMATQRPSVDVITGVIKANFPSRVSFKVTSKIDSRTILGEQGAEQLLGMGDMLFMGNSTKITRVHGPFVEDGEVEQISVFWKHQAPPDYVTSVTESEEEESEFSAALDSINGEDNDSSLYRQAVQVVKKDRKVSTSYIQRCLRIGYNRAATLIDKMEKEGIISPPNHSGKREILLAEE